MPKISVILPIYNGEKYLEACLESVRSQTFTDFECLCVNDGSPDNSAEIVERFIEKDSRFILINQENAGVSAARNTGIDTAKGEFIAFIDQDDMYHSQILEVLLHMIITTCADVAALMYKMIPENSIYKEDNITISDLNIKVSEKPLDDFFSDEQVRRVEIWLRLYKRNIINVKFPEGIQPAEDAVFTMKLFNQIDKLAYSDAPLYLHRASATSIMEKGITDKYMNSFYQGSIILYQYFKEAEVSNEAFFNFRKYIARMVVYEHLVRRFIRSKIDTDIRKQLYSKYRKMVHDMYKNGIFTLQGLSLRKKLLIKAYMYNFTFLLKLLCSIERVAIINPPKRDEFELK